MILNKQLKKELIQILREDLEMDISEKEVFEIGQNLINFFEALIEVEYEQNYKKD